MHSAEDRSPTPRLPGWRQGLRALLPLGLALALASCASLAPQVPSTPLTAGEADPSHLVTVTLSADDTPAGVAERLQGRVLVWEPGDFAVVGVSEGAATAAGEPIETNERAFVAGAEPARMNGSSRLWAGGSSRLWAGGSSRLWAGGSGEPWDALWHDGAYTWMPENTAIWQQIQLERAHRMAPRLGRGVVVAVIDTGVDLTHPALREALAPAEAQWDFVGDDPVPQEEGTSADPGYGHGTHVAGIVRQIAPRATILPLRVLDSDGSGNVLHLAAAIDWAVKQKARVINLSLGSDEPSEAVEAAIRAATRRGVLVVASSGNSGDENITFPAAFARSGRHSEQRLSVTSVDPADAKSSFATFGAAVEIAAPGEDVHGPAPAEGQASWSGTSMAAPMASGALALLLAEKSTEPRRLGAEFLKQHAADLYRDGLNSAYTGALGDGRLDVAAFLYATLQEASHDGSPGNDDPGSDAPAGDDPETDPEPDPETDPEPGTDAGGDPDRANHDGQTHTDDEEPRPGDRGDGGTRAG